MTSENNVNFKLDNLLQEAIQTVKEKKTQEKEVTIKFVSDLGLRWQQISYSDLGRESDSGLDVQGDQTIHQEMMNKASEIRFKISTRESALKQKIEKAKELLAEEGLDSDMRKKIAEAVKEEQQNWEEEIKQLEDQQKKYHNEEVEAHSRALEKEKKAKMADENQRDFKKYSMPKDLQSYKLDPKEAGEKLFQILVERPENEQENMKTFREWIYNNMLQREEQKFIDELVEKGWEKILDIDEIQREAEKQFQNKISEIVQMRTGEEDFEFELKKMEEELNSVNQSFENLKIWTRTNTDQTVLLGDIENELLDLIKKNEKELRRWEESKTKKKNKKRINRNNQLCKVFDPIREKMVRKQQEISKNIYDINTILYHIKEKINQTNDFPMSDAYWGQDGKSIVKRICQHETPRDLDKLPPEIFVLAEKLFLGDTVSGVFKKKIRELEQSNFLDIPSEEETKIKNRIKFLKEETIYDAREKRIVELREFLKEIENKDFTSGSKMKTVPDEEW